MSHPRTFSRALRLCVLIVGAACAGPVAALTLQGATFIAPSTTIPTCGAICGGFGSNILEIADGNTSNFNGWAGADNQVGTIKLDLLGNFDLTSFSLWNDINVFHEGVGDFRLRFYNATNALLSTSSTFTAPDGQFAAGVYNFASVANVSRVDLEVLTLLTGGVCCRIEIREVAFQGQNSTAVPELGTWALMLGGFGLAGAMLRRRSRSPSLALHRNTAQTPG